MTCLLGIDLGTSSVRAMILRDSGETVGLAGAGYNVDIPGPGRAEQDADMWIAKADDVIKRALTEAGIDAADIKAIGFSGQMHGMVCVDEDGVPLRPAMIWQDQRSRDCIQEMYERLGRGKIGGWVQNAVATGFLVASLYWLKQNEPETYARIYRVMLPKDYLKFRLSGKIHCDYSDAASTTAFDNIHMRWSSEFLEALGIDVDKFPPCSASTEILGPVTPEAAARTGLSEKTLVTNGGSDQCMQAIGNGIVTDGIFSSNIGTGGQVSAGMAKPFYDRQFRTSTFAHALPGRWTVMGAVLSAGASMKWLATKVLEMDDFSSVDSLAGQTPAGSGGLVFLPYLAGERTPHFDPTARALFCGLTLSHDRRNMLRAVMEGVSFALKDSFEIIIGLGVECTRMIASGGGANSPLWLQIQADVFEREIARSLNNEQACLGAAITAGVATGVYKDFASACAGLVKFDGKTYQPIEANVKIYRELYPQYQKLYRDNRDSFAKLTDVDDKTA